MFILRSIIFFPSKPNSIMKKIFLFLLLVGFMMNANSLKAQTMNLSQPVPAPFPVCQCDSLDITYQISTANFPFGTRFYVEITTDAGQDFTNADTLDIVKFLPNGNPNVDTISIGIKTATVIVPCDQSPLGNFIRIVASTGEISDTNNYNVLNRTLSEIKQVIGGFPNPYTGADDWGFCTGDSIRLVAETHASFFQWKRGGTDIPGETSDTLWVKQSGLYSVDTWVSPSCKTTSEDTLINTFLPRTDITLMTTPPQAHQIDIAGKLDSVMFCEGSSAVLAGPPAVAGTTYKYEWLTDSVDGFGKTYYYATDPGDTFIQVTIDTSKVDSYYAKVYLRTEDGFCVDTSDAYYIVISKKPVIQVGNTDLPISFPTVYAPGNACLKDSIMLRAIDTNGGPTFQPNWRYQWQRANTSAIPFTWMNVTDSTEFEMQVDTSLKPIQTLSYYRLRIRTVTPQENVVCEVFTDSVAVRWWGPYGLTVPAGQPGVTMVGMDSVSMCETDSVTVMGPTSPDSFQLPYKYQWLTDSMDGANLVIYPLAGETLQSLKINEGGRYYLDIDDGICTDRYSTFRVFTDTLARTTILNVPFPSNPGPGTSLDLCLYDSVLVTANDTVLPQWQYQWQQFTNGVGWVNMLNDTLPSLQIDTANALYDTSHFRLNTSYVNQFGITTCQYFGDSIEVRFYELPNLSFFPNAPGDSIGLCLNDSVLLVAQGNSFNYNWTDGVVGASRWISTPGNYTVVGTGFNGCQSTRTMKVYLQQTQANAGPDQTILSGEVATLTGSGGAKYQWYASKPLNFNDFLSKEIQVSKLIPDSVEADTIWVYMIATGENGCSGLDSLQLIIQNPKGSEVVNLEKTYNLFTPNGDGKNDNWNIRHIVEGKACEILIMNRWGATVYEDKTFTGLWDGTDSGGNPLPDGTYYYILSCNNTVMLKSAVTIIRNQ